MKLVIGGLVTVVIVLAAVLGVLLLKPGERSFVGGSNVKSGPQEIAEDIFASAKRDGNFVRAAEYYDWEERLRMMEGEITNSPRHKEENNQMREIFDAQTLKQMVVLSYNDAARFESFIKGLELPEKHKKRFLRDLPKMQKKLEKNREAFTKLSFKVHDGKEVVPGKFIVPVASTRHGTNRPKGHCHIVPILLEKSKGRWFLAMELGDSMLHDQGERFIMGLTSPMFFARDSRVLCDPNLIARADFHKKLYNTTYVRERRKRYRR